MWQEREHPGEQHVLVSASGVELEGELALPAGARGVIVFAHGSGSSRHSPRNRQVARALQSARLGTLLLDLLTAREEREDRMTRHLRFDIDLLARRLAGARAWLCHDERTRDLTVGYFGASTGAAAALIAAAAQPEGIFAIVSRGGRPDLAGPDLGRVKAPTLLIVGGADTPVLELNRHALGQLGAKASLHVVPGATHLFEEPGALEEVTRVAVDWFVRLLGPRGESIRPGAARPLA